MMMTKQGKGQKGLKSPETTILESFGIYLERLNKCNHCNISLVPENNLKQHTMKGLESRESRTWLSSCKPLHIIRTNPFKARSSACKVVIIIQRLTL